MIHTASHSFVDRLGFHYFSDTNHYSQKDADIWIAELTNLGAIWLVLKAPLQRAIPEHFITRVVEAGMQPILHFTSNCDDRVDHDDLRLLLKSYASWGVQYVIIYDRPNSRNSWSPVSWVQTDLVERFLDSYLPIAEIILEEKMIPGFPPLEPGGDFWDLAFLRLALRSIIRRGQIHILDSLVLGAYGDIFNRSLAWGAGGVERWQGVRPYSENHEQQDHQGFRIFEWYLEIVQQEIERLLPLFLMGLGGFKNENSRREINGDEDNAYKERLTTLLEKMTIDGIDPTTGQPFPDELLGCFFDGLFPTQYAISGNFKQEGESGYLHSKPDAMHIKRILRWSQTRTIKTSPSRRSETKPDQQMTMEIFHDNSDPSHTRINHYVLLPLYAWGAADWDLEMIQPLIQQSHPTIGYSLDEALQADRVTIVGGPGAITEEALNMLREAGCLVQRMMPDGTFVAT